MGNWIERVREGKKGGREGGMETVIEMETVIGITQWPLYTGT
jgi:hypothetical protein